MLKPRLTRYFEEYADSHRHPTNRLTHKIAIPLIVFHVVAMLDWVHLAQIPGTAYELTLGHLAFVGALAFYLTLDVKLALVMGLFYAVCFPIGWHTPRMVVIGIAAGGWLIQLAGHLVWEKKQPAFLTNMLQALIGPLFFAAVLLGDWPPKTVGAPVKSA